MKNSLIIILFVFTFLLSGCSNSKPITESHSVKTPVNKQTDTNINKAHNINDYYPFTPNTKYTYEGKGMEYATFTSWVDYISGSKIQLRTNNGGTEVVKVLENKGGELKTIFSKEECYYRENLIAKPSNKEEILLKEPLIKGTSWTLSDGRKRFISNSDVEIDTPSGNYKALEVTTSGSGSNSEDKTLDYYALNIGLVKTIFNSGGMEVISTLSKMEKSSALVQKVKFYYPNITDDKLYYSPKDLTFSTNDLTKIAFEKLFKESPNKELGKVLSLNSKIKSLYLSDSNVVYVDFSKEFTSEMNAGSGYESMILQCITNTLGDYYGVNKVYITVENTPYSSGHILMKKGEAFTVNTKDSVSLQK